MKCIKCRVREVENNNVICEKCKFEITKKIMLNSKSLNYNK